MSLRQGETERNQRSVGAQSQDVVPAVCAQDTVQVSPAFDSVNTFLAVTFNKRITFGYQGAPVKRDTDNQTAF